MTATVAMKGATLEIEPYASLLYSSASPFSFKIDQYTVGYLTSRFIVFRCIPLNQEHYLALPPKANALQVKVSEDGELFALL